MAQEKARFCIKVSIASQLQAAGISLKSALAGHVFCIEKHLGPHFARVVLEARQATDESTVDKLATLHGLKSAPINDISSRRRLHEAVRIVSKSVLETRTESGDGNRILVGPPGTNTYSRENSIGTRQRTNNQRGPRPGIPYQHHTQNQNGRHYTSNRLNNRHSKPSVPVVAVDSRLAGWSNLVDTIQEKDRVADAEAHERVQSMVEIQNAAGVKRTETFRRTAMVNGQRTTVEVSKCDTEQISKTAGYEHASDATLSQPKNIVKLGPHRKLGPHNTISRTTQAAGGSNSQPNKHNQDCLTGQKDAKAGRLANKDGDVGLDPANSKQAGEVTQSGSTTVCKLDQVAEGFVAVFAGHNGV